MQNTTNVLHIKRIDGNATDIGQYAFRKVGDVRLSPSCPNSDHLKIPHIEKSHDLAGTHRSSLKSHDRDGP
jgi:hypothetical protein